MNSFKVFIATFAPKTESRHLYAVALGAYAYFLTSVISVVVGPAGFTPLEAHPSLSRFELRVRRVAAFVDVAFVSPTLESLFLVSSRDIYRRGVCCAGFGDSGDSLSQTPQETQLFHELVESKEVRSE